MPAPAVTIRVKAGPQLMERIQAASRRLDVTPGSFIEFAIECELSRQEEERDRERNTLAHLQERLLSKGQIVSLHTGDGEEDECQLCLRPIPARDEVQGPLLCNTCHALAKGAGAAP